MSKCRFLLSSRILWCLALSFTGLVLFQGTSHAGSLFPPANATKTGTTFSCPNNSSLVWSTLDNGSLRCADTTNMVTVAACPAGQVMTGISNGNAVCTTAAQTSTTTANCPSGQVMTGLNNGSPVCSVPTSSSGSSGSSITVSCPNGQILTGLNNGSPVCTSSVYTGTAGLFVMVPGSGWGAAPTCRIPNPNTGGCSCPPGYRVVELFFATGSPALGPNGVLLYSCNR